MIGLFNNNEKGKITQHLSTFIENKNNLNHEIDELKQKIEKNVNDYTEYHNKFNVLYDEMTSMKECLKTTVNAEDLNELVNDIRTSFEMFINSNHTPRQNKLEETIENLRKRVDDLETRMNVFFNGEVELITVENQKEVKKTSKVPKLDIKKNK